MSFLQVVLFLLALGVDTAPIHMSELGVYCGGYQNGPADACGESTPILWPPTGDRHLAVVERHSNFRVRWQRFRGVGNNSIICDSIPHSSGFAFSSSIVVKDTLFVFGTNDVTVDGKYQPRTVVQVFWSSSVHLEASSWQTKTVLVLDQKWTAFNTSPTKGKLKGVDTYVLAIELGSPEPLTGHRFTSVFATCRSCAESGNLSTGWSLLDPHTHIYTPKRYSACPTIRHFGEWFYVVTLFEGIRNPKGPNCDSDSRIWHACLAEHVVRTKDLSTWQESKYNGGLIMGLPDGKNLTGPDHHIIPQSYLAETGSAATKQFARNQTDDVNRSDMDMVTLPTGETYVIWLTGNQGEATPPNKPMGFSAAGVVNATEQGWLESFFA